MNEQTNEPWPCTVAKLCLSSRPCPSYSLELCKFIVYCLLLCSVELNVDAREKGGELYCLRCHDKMGIPICGACRLETVLNNLLCLLCHHHLIWLFSIYQYLLAHIM